MIPPKATSPANEARARLTSDKSDENNRVAIPCPIKDSGMITRADEIIAVMSARKVVLW
jgi:hypothetical protein